MFQSRFQFSLAWDERVREAIIIMTLLFTNWGNCTKGSKYHKSNKNLLGILSGWRLTKCGPEMETTELQILVRAEIIPRILESKSGVLTVRLHNLLLV